MADFSVKKLSEDINFNQLEYWDVVIIGAGPAGLAAGLTTAHRALTTLVIEAKEKSGGQPNFLYSEKKIVDIPGFPEGISGKELSTRLFKQAEDALVQFRFNEELIGIEESDREENGEKLKLVKTNRGQYLCRKVILAIGLLHNARKLPVLDELNSKKVSYRIKSGAKFENKHVAIVGGGDSALDAAVMVQERGGSVTLIVREKAPIGKPETLRRILHDGGKLISECEIQKASEKDTYLNLELSNGESHQCHHVIVHIGFLSAKGLLNSLGLDQKEDGSIVVDSYYETSSKGVFAVGDVHGDIKLIAVAWAEGIQSAIYAFKEITSPYWLSEKRLKDYRLKLMGNKIVEAAKLAKA